MDFEKAYEHFLNGTATEEEAEFVKTEIAKLKRIETILSDNPSERPTIEKTDREQVKKAKKQYTVKTFALTLSIVVISILIIAGAVCGGVFGTAVTSANASLNISDAQAKQLAIDYAKDYAEQNFSFANISAVVTDFDKELKIEPSLTRSRYIYYIEVKVSAALELEMSIDAKSGFITLVDVDIE